MDIDASRFETMTLIAKAVEDLERWGPDVEEGTRRHACVRLAWHHLMDAYKLLAAGRLTPDDFRWGDSKARDMAQK